MLLALPLGELSPQVTERAHAVNSVAKVSIATRNLPATTKSRPLGEGGIAAGDDGRGKLPQSKPDGFASSLGEGANPLSLLTAFAASSPEGGAFGIFRPARIKLPLRGSWHRVAMTERVYRSLGQDGRGNFHFPTPKS